MRAPDLPPYVHGDETKLRQILINLLGNALKFTSTGSVTLSARALFSASGSNACRLAFAVTDTGSGIAPEEIDGLFGIFAQAHAGRQSSEGSGLGLAISRSYVLLMGGDIRIESRIAQGTTVSFDLPVGISGMVDVATPFAQSARHVIGLAPGQMRYRILIADDRREARQLLVRLLAPLGVELREAVNGQEAVDIWEAWQPQLILMDMRMPVIDGRDATRRIKSTDAGKATVVIALTANTFEEERADILAAGCNDFLRKPFREADLFSMMHKHLGICFIYTEETAAADPPILEESRLAMLSPGVLTALTNALAQLDIEGVNAIVEEIARFDPRLASALSELAKNFQYDQILDSVRRVDGSS
jgi:CheY-like chemotaxis protein